MRRLLIRLIEWHGLKQGDFMHERCVICACWRQYETQHGYYRVRGLWRLPIPETVNYLAYMQDGIDIQLQ